MMDGLKKSHKRSLANLSKIFQHNKQKPQQHRDSAQRFLGGSPPLSPTSCYDFYNASYAAFDTVSSSSSTTSSRTSSSSHREGEEEDIEESGGLDLKGKPQMNLRRHSFSHVHDTSKARMAKQKRSEYIEKMNAFDDLIRKRRGSTVRMMLDAQ